MNLHFWLWQKFEIFVWKETETREENYVFQNSVVSRTLLERNNIRGKRIELSKYTYDVILMHEGAKASSLDHTSIDLNKRHYRGSPTKFEIHIPQTLDTIQQDRSNDPLQRSVKRDADTVELITRDIISGSYRGSAFRS